MAFVSLLPKENNNKKGNLRTASCSQVVIANEGRKTTTKAQQNDSTKRRWKGEVAERRWKYNTRSGCVSFSSRVSYEIEHAILYFELFIFVMRKLSSLEGTTGNLFGQSKAAAAVCRRYNLAF